MAVAHITLDQLRMLKTSSSIRLSIGLQGQDGTENPSGRVRQIVVFNQEDYNVVKDNNSQLVKADGISNVLAVSGEIAP
jgi:hypothetical protein